MERSSTYERGPAPALFSSSREPQPALFSSSREPPPANPCPRGHSLHEEQQASMGVNGSRATRGLATLAGTVAMAACGSAGDGELLYEPWIAGPGPRQPAF